MLARRGKERRGTRRDVQVVVFHLAHAVGELTRERQGLPRRRRRRSSGQVWWDRWGWIDVHRLVLGAFKSRWRGLRRGLRRGSHTRVAFLDEMNHQEDDESAENESSYCHLNVNPSGSQMPSLPCDRTEAIPREAASVPITEVTPPVLLTRGGLVPKTPSQRQPPLHLGTGGTWTRLSTAKSSAIRNHAVWRRRISPHPWNVHDANITVLIDVIAYVLRHWLSTFIFLITKSPMHRAWSSLKRIQTLLEPFHHLYLTTGQPTQKRACAPACSHRRRDLE